MAAPNYGISPKKCVIIWLTHFRYGFVWVAVVVDFVVNVPKATSDATLIPEADNKSNDFSSCL